MKGGAVIRVEPVTRIERQEIDLGSFRERRRLVHNEPAILNTGLESHVVRILRVGTGPIPPQSFSTLSR